MSTVENNIIDDGNYKEIFQNQKLKINPEFVDKLVTSAKFKFQNMNKEFSIIEPIMPSLDLIDEEYFQEYAEDINSSKIDVGDDKPVSDSLVASARSSFWSKGGDLPPSKPVSTPVVEKFVDFDLNDSKLFDPSAYFSMGGDLPSEAKPPEHEELSPLAKTADKGFNDDLFAEEQYQAQAVGDSKPQEDINVVFQLDKKVEPSMQASLVPPKPLMAGPSILDNSIVELEAMDIQDLRAQLMDEIQALEGASPEYRKIQLQKIFGRIIEFEPNNPLFPDDSRFTTEEHRLYADLISTPGLYELSYVREFLKNDFAVFSDAKREQKDLLIKIYDYYDTHSPEAIEKFNYIFRSSDTIAYDLNDLTSSLDTYFNERVMHSFSKEDLCQLFRLSLYHSTYMKTVLKDMFSDENAKELFIISQMTKRVKESIGHSSEFMAAIIDKLDNQYVSSNFKALLNNVYDEFIHSKEDEKTFEQTLARNEDFVLIRELINYVVVSSYDKSVSTYLFNQSKTVEEFLKAAKDYREEHHQAILGYDGLDKVLAGTFNPQTDFKKIESPTDLKDFKNALFYNLYGISIKEAKHLKKHYGRFMDELMKGLPPKPDNMSDEEYLDSLDESKMTIMKKDYATLQMFKAINSIYDLDIDDPQLQDKVQVLQEAYWQHIQQKGLDYQHSMASAILVEGLLNNMFMNTYNKRLLNVSDAHKVLRVDDGVTLLDAGVEFDMLVTSLSGTGSSFFSNSVNMASKWNTAALSDAQGICTSHISSQNLGIIDLKSPILAFTNLPSSCLNAMGSSDVYTVTREYNLRQKNDSRIGYNRSFIPATVMSNQTRYGYNEILIDRFMVEDEKGQLKLQPDYLVFYKLDDGDFVKNVTYHQTKKMAKDFGIPIMVVDVPKIKEHEKTVIKEMEEKLFASETVDAQLVEDIVTRYMNNYSGSLTLADSNIYKYRYGEDFSVGGMQEFFEKVFKKVRTIEDKELKSQWVDAVEEAYKLEKARYDEAKSVSKWNSSVSTFVLDDISLSSKINTARWEVIHGTSIDTSDLDETAELNETMEDEDKTAELPNDVVTDANDSGWTSEPAIVENPDEYPPVTLMDGTSGIFVTETSYKPEIKTIVDFVNYLEMGTTFKVIENVEHLGTVGKVILANQTSDDATLLVENLMMSYFLENCKIATTVELSYDLGTKVNFSVTDNYDWNKKVMQSPFEQVLNPNGIEFIPLDHDKLQTYVLKVEAMDNTHFLQIFQPIIAQISKTNGEPVETIADRLLTKKAAVSEVFNKLEGQVAAFGSGDEALSSGDDAKEK